MTPADLRPTASETPELVPPEPEPELVAVPDPEPLPQTEPLAELARDLDELDVDTPRVAILVSATADLLPMERAETELEARQIRSESRVLPVDEDRAALAAYVENAQLRGIRVLIAGAGPHARLPEAVTEHTRLPVIGGPLSSAGARADEIEDMLGEMTGGTEDPIAWVALDDAAGAAVLAARILGA
jgi:5-(carboxyamino)imidazole ribonucleotide mutase